MRSIFVVCFVIVLALCAIPELALAQQGYWKLAGAVEFWNPRVPPNGPASQTQGIWTCTHSVQEGRFQFTSTAKTGQTPVVYVTEMTWTPPPTAIYPGEVVPVRARGAIVEARGPGVGHGQIGVQCVIARKIERNGVIDPAPLVNLFGTTANRDSLIGKAGAYKEFINTSEYFGQKGGANASFPDIYLLFQGGGAIPACEMARGAYRYQWVNATPAATASLGKVWRVKDEAWVGTWTRRGSTNVFDAVWIKGSLKLTGLLKITINGGDVVVDRTESSNGDVCTYNGKMGPDGRSVAGMVKCYGGGGSVTRWAATIEGQ